jgi:hypothetical protein
MTYPRCRVLLPLVSVFPLLSATFGHVGRRRTVMKRESIRVEPLSSYLERWKAPTSAVTRCGETIYGSGFPPFDPKTGGDRGSIH